MQDSNAYPSSQRSSYHSLLLVSSYFCPEEGRVSLGRENNRPSWEFRLVNEKSYCQTTYAVVFLYPSTAVDQLRVLKKKVPDIVRSHAPTQSRAISAIDKIAEYGVGTNPISNADALRIDILVDAFSRISHLVMSQLAPTSDSLFLLI